MITAERLRELLFYDAHSGLFTWRVHCRKRKPGTGAGYMCNGYVLIGLDGLSYRAHRLAWLYMLGEWPKGHIDHKDGHPWHNKFSNLRDVTQSVNMQNTRRAKSDSTTGLLGVSPSRGRFVARITAKGRERHIGSFKTAAEAHAAYLKAKRALHEGCMI